MALTKLSTIPDIIAYMQSIIRQHRPLANVEQGFPLYDMLIEPFADLFYRERIYLYDIDKLADMVSLFDDSGNLLYPEYADFLINKYFIGTEDIQGAVHTIYFYFSAKCDFSIGPNSFISYNTTTFTIDPVSISKSDSSWEAGEGGTCRIAITIVGQVNSTYTLSPTSSVSAPWNTDNVRITIGMPNGTTFQGARNVSTLTGVTSPVVTLDLLKNSVSNRSYSNTRSINYFLKVNTAFTPDKLKQSKVLKYKDKFFIDNYVDIVSRDKGADLEHTSIKLSGMGKVLLDYGNDFYVSEALLEYVGSNDFFPLVEPVTITGDDHNQIQTLHVTGADATNTSNGYLFYKLTLDKAAQTITVEFHKTVPGGLVATAVYTETGGDERYYMKGHYMTIVESAGSGIGGEIYVKWQENLALWTGRVMGDLTPAFYRVKFPWTKGVIAPVALVESHDPTTGESTPDTALAIANAINDSLTTTAFTMNSGFKVLLTGTKYKVLNDDNFLFVGGDISGVSLANSSLFSLAWEVDTHNTLPIPTAAAPCAAALKIYKSSERTLQNLVAYVDLDAYTTYTNIPLQPYPLPAGSGITGTVTLSAVIEDKDDQNYIVPKSSIAGFSNDYLYLNLSINEGAQNQYDGKYAYLVYAGTDEAALTNSQNGFNDPANMETSCVLNVSPYRGLIFSTYFDRDYIMPFADTTAARARYLTFFAELESYFDTYTGAVSSIDFKALSSLMHSKTGLYMKRLDYTVCTQRGHLIRGIIDIGDEETEKIIWGDIQQVIADTVDTSHPQNVITEAIATNEALYKPILSVIGI